MLGRQILRTEIGASAVTQHEVGTTLSIRSNGRQSASFVSHWFGFNNILTRNILVKTLPRFGNGYKTSHRHYDDAVIVSFEVQIILGGFYQ